MRVVRLVIVASLGLPLAGCLGVTIPEKPVPDWAVSPQAQADEVRGEARKQRTVRRATPTRYAAPERTLVTGEAAAKSESAASSSALKPFTPEWQAQESARDERLRQRMNICSGC